MVIKIVSYFDIPGKFTPEEGNELTKDLRKAVNDYLMQTLQKGITGKLSTGKQISANILSEEAAKEKVLGGSKFPPIKSSPTEISFTRK